MVSLVLDFPWRGSIDELVLLLSYSTLLFLLYRVLYVAHRRIFYALLCIMLPLAFMFSGYHLMTGREVSYNVIASIYETNPRELAEFVSSRFFVLLSGFSGAAFLAVISLTSSEFPLTPDFLRSLENKKCGVALLVFSVLGLAFVSQHYQLRDFYPARDFVKNYKYFTETYSVALEYLSTPYLFEGDLESLVDSNMVLVVGEASRRSSMSIYGGDDETTPVLENFQRKHPDNLLLFDDAISAATFTRVSVPSLLSTATAEEYLKVADYPSIIRILRSAGFHTEVLSNQERGGYYNGLTTALLSESNSLGFSGWRNRGHDENLLPLIERYLKKSIAKPQFLMIHLSGSHFDYRQRYPSTHRHFSPDTMENAYKNSIRYTDYILGEIITMLMDQVEPFAMLYVSDHGEYVNDFGDGLYGHDMRKMTRFESEVPFLIVFNSAFSERHHQKIQRMRPRSSTAISHDNVSHIILGLLGAEDVNFYEADLDISSLDFKANIRHQVNQDLEIVRYTDVEFDGD